MNPTPHRTYTFLLLAALLAGCAGLSPSPTPTTASTSIPATSSTTPSPSPTLTVTPSPTLTPTIAPSSTPVVVTPPPKDAASATAASLIPDDFVFPEAKIQILEPGPLSRVSSPLRYEATLTPGDDGRVNIELVGEDGRVIARRLRIYEPPYDQEIRVAGRLDFEVLGAAEAGRLQFSVNDEFGRPKYLASVNLVLLSEGSDEITPPSDFREAIIIQQPYANTMTEGDTLAVAGFVRAQDDLPLEIKLYDQAGKVLAYGSAPVYVPPGEQYGIFAGEVTFNVSDPTWVRLVLSAQGEHVPGLTHTVSLLTVIGP